MLLRRSKAERIITYSCKAGDFIERVKRHLDAFVESSRNIFKENLTGIYLHGSLAMGCFNPAYSDLDILAVVAEDTDSGQKRMFVDSVLSLSQECDNDFEISILLEEDVRPFRHPTRFILHYSSMYRDRYRNEPGFICGSGEDPDLAAHITIALNRGVCLYGRPANQVFDPVPEKYYIDSIMSDIEYARGRIAEKPEYFILNTCRILYYLREKAICSKKEGGEWGRAKLPPRFSSVIGQALLYYSGPKKSLLLEPAQISEFADFILEEISVGQAEILNAGT